LYLEGPEAPIFRQNVIPEGRRLLPEDMAVHTYPYDKLPILQSHLHPKFVLINAGSKLVDLKTALINKIFEDFPITRKVVELYQAWTRPITDNNVDNDPSYNPPHVSDVDDSDDPIIVNGDDPNNSDYDDKTKPVCSGYCRPKQKASTGIKQNSVKRKRSNTASRKVLSKSSVHNLSSLSKEALSRLNQQNEGVVWTSGLIRQWSNKDFSLNLAQIFPSSYFP
jgi:hypothetical protein